LQLKINASILLIILAVLFTACIGQKNGMILRPEPGPGGSSQTGPQEIWQIIETQNGLPGNGIPEWVSLYLNEGIPGLEALDRYNSFYVFIGENRAINLTALKQWAKGFSAAQDFPRLLAQRVENRLTASASLYPDDEYGEYFEKLMKQVADAEYPAVKEEQFWIKRMRIPDAVEDDDPDALPEQDPSPTERYEFFILLDIDKDSLQNQIRRIMAGIKTDRPPTREQAAAISRVQNAFFTGF
jgi:hypothetical protein